MMLETGKSRTANLLLPFALFGFLAPIATYLVAVSNVSANWKTGILSVLAGLYALLFVISYNRLRATMDERSLAKSIGSKSADFNAIQYVLENKESSVSRDPLTGLVNDRGFHIVLERELAECRRRRDERSMSVLVIEVCDHEKEREMHGEDVNARVSMHAAAVINNSVRAMDVAAILGGGQFGVVLPTADVKGAAESSQRIESAFADSPFAFDNEEQISIGIYIGFSTFPIDGDTAQSLIECATARKSEIKNNVRRRENKPAGEYLN